MGEDASDTEEEKFQSNSSDSNSSSNQLKEANINMSAREVLDSCRGKEKENARALITVNIHFLTFRSTFRGRRIPGFASFSHLIS
jgi:hypothetical protein